MSETDKVLLIERRGSIAIVTLNRPDKRNALSEKLWGELKTTFENFEPEVRCVVLAGAGKHFCAGLDLSEHRHREAFNSIFTSRFAHATLDDIQFRRPAGGDGDAGRGDRRRAGSRDCDACARGRPDDLLSAAGGPPRLLCRRRRERLGLSHYLVEPGKTLEKAIELAETIAKNARIPNYLIVQAIPRIEDVAVSDGNDIQPIFRTETQMA
jgi:(methylthio)acryloyl-CoA hydratase